MTPRIGTGRSGCRIGIGKRPNWFERIIHVERRGIGADHGADHRVKWT